MFFKLDISNNIEWIQTQIFNKGVLKIISFFFVFMTKNSKCEDLSFFNFIKRIVLFGFIFPEK